MTSLKQSFVQKYLEPGDSLSEVFFGLIMVLTFTLGAGLAASEGQQNTREILIAIIGCNLAWGIIDGVMYIMGSLFDRGRQARMVKALRQAPSEDAAITAIGRQLDSTLAPILNQQERNGLYHRMMRELEQMPPLRTQIEIEDIFGAIASFWLVFISTIPAVIPFFFIPDFYRALRISNGLLLGLLFVVGFTWAKYTNSNRWVSGFSMMGLGLALVIVAIAFGG